MYYEEDHFDDGYGNEQQRSLAALEMGAASDYSAEECACKGSGWILSNMDVWAKCPYHKGPHPFEDEEGRSAEQEMAEALKTRWVKKAMDADETATLEQMSAAYDWMSRSTFECCRDFNFVVVGTNVVFEKWGMFFMHNHKFESGEKAATFCCKVRRAVDGGRKLDPQHWVEVECSGEVEKALYGWE